MRVAEVDDRADEGGAALRPGDAGKRPEELCHVLGIACAVARIARRAHPRGAAQRVDDDAGVVGDGGQPGRGARRARLDEGVLDEGQSGLFRGLDAEGILRDEAQPGRRQDRSQLRELSLIRACEDDVHVRISSGAGRATGDGRRALQPARAARCISTRDAMPRCARSSIASSSARRNAWPSAVPWTSMNPPASFITTFMSVSASESSA